MRTATSARWAAITLGVGVALGVLFYPTDEKRVREVAEAIVTAANASPTELSRALADYASPKVSVNVTELPEPLTGRDAIVAALEQAQQLGAKPQLRIEGVDVSVQGNQARVNADLITTPSAEVPELRRPRHSVALFEKQAGKFRLVSVEIGSERRDQPEARP